MSIVISLHGNDTARCGDIEAKSARGGPVCLIARKLIDAGENPKAQCIVERDGRVVFGRSALSFWAGRTVSEGDASIRFAKWSPFDRQVIE